MGRNLASSLSIDQVCSKTSLFIQFSLEGFNHIKQAGNVQQNFWAIGFEVRHYRLSTFTALNNSPESRLLLNILKCALWLGLTVELENTHTLKRLVWLRKKMCKMFFRRTLVAKWARQADNTKKLIEFVWHISSLEFYAMLYCFGPWTQG